MQRSHTYDVQLSRLRSLTSNPQPLRKIHFRLDSDTCPARDSYLDLYVPEFHQYGSSTDRPVRHLDITSTWRGLSTAHAEELKFWEEMFAAVLEYTVSNHLIDLMDDMDDCNIDRYPGDLDGRFCTFVNTLGGKTIPVNVREIINCMLELYRRHGCQHQWLASSGSFYNALCEFLRTRDCFLDTPLHPTIKITFSACLSSQCEPTVVATLRRFGPVMGFNRLDAFTREQAWCEIHPAYMEPTLDPSYASYLGRPEYRLASDWIKFDWDINVEGFRGYVRPLPHLGDSRAPNCLNVDLAVVSKRFFPDRVILERNLRVKIKLSVCQLTGLPTDSASKEGMPELQRCRARRSLFKPPPELRDLGEVMKANKRSAASSPTKSLRRKGKTPQKGESKERTAPVPAAHDRMDLCGKNVPAWQFLPDHSTEADTCPSPAEGERAEVPSSRTRTACLGKSLSDVFEDPAYYPFPSPALPGPSDARLKARKSEPSPPLSLDGKPPTSSSSEGYLVIQQPHYPSSPPDMSGSNAPLEMKRSTKRPTSKQPCYTITHFPSVAVTPQPPARAPTPACPVSAPHPPFKRIDPALNATAVPAASERRRLKRSASTLWVSTDEAVSDSHGFLDDATWARWRDDEAETDLDHHHRQRIAATAAAAAAAAANAADDAKAEAESRLLSEWCRPIVDDGNDGDERVERFRKSIREWYDVMLLKRDIPCRKTRDEASQEDAFQDAFLAGSDSGDDGDVEVDE